MKSLAVCLMLLPCLSWMASSSHTMAEELETPSSFEWAISAGGTLHDKTRCIAVDPAGNILLTGEFTGTATFGEQTRPPPLLAATYRAERATPEPRHEAPVAGQGLGLA